MRNLKKALALVLALMMALSLMSFASAADYADDSAIAQDEAVSVMSALGVFNGTDGGNFDPNGTLTRAQAAKIITYMLLGKEVADSLPNTGSKFTDCPDGRWYVGSVNYLTDLGIVSGRSDTIFDPGKTVNGYEFAKMLLGALGYDSKVEKFEGDSGWSLNIATLARRAGLNADLAVSVISTAPLTREQAAKLAFNTLKATMVYYEGGVSVGDVVVNPTRKEVSNASSNHYDTTVAGDTLMQFCEQYFPGLKYQAYITPDDFGHTPDGRWVNGDDAAYVNLAEPTLVLTDKVSEANLTKMLPKNATINGGSVTPTTNGAAAESAVTTIAELAALTAPGKMVEIYVNDDNKVETIITTTYTVRTVDNITEKNGATTYTFSGLSSKTNNDDKTEVVLTGTIAKGDTVTTVTAGGKVYVYPTNKFTGNQTAKKVADGVTTVTIGGVPYVVGVGLANLANADAFVNSKDEANYWVDVNGYLVKVDGIKTQVDLNYAVITRVIVGTSTPSLDNETSYTVNIRAVVDSGDVLDATLKTSINKTAHTNGAAEWTGDTMAVGDLICGNVKLDDSSVAEADVKTALEGKLFGYYIDNGKMVLDKVDFNATIAKDGTYGLYMADDYASTTSHAGKSGDPDQSGITALFNSKTVFVIYGIDGVKVTAQAHTGTAGLNVNDGDGGLAIITGNSATQGTATVVFLETTIAAPTVDYVYIDKDTAVNVLHNDKNVYAYDGINPDGEKDTYYTSDATALTYSGLYEFNADKVIGDPMITTNTAKDDHSDAAGNEERVENIQVNEDLVYVGNDWVRTTDETKTVLADGVEAVAGSNCFVVMKDAKTVAAIFAYEAYACPHTSRTQTTTKTANCHETGISTAYYTCDECGKFFDAATDGNELTQATVDGYVTEIDPETHTGSASWQTGSATTQCQKKYDCCGKVTDSHDFKDDDNNSTCDTAHS